MRNLTVFLASGAFLALSANIAFSQPGKISLKWLKRQLKGYNAYLCAGMERNFFQL